MAAVLLMFPCSLIKDFELEARADGMAQKELTDRRRFMADELNRFINMKKDFTSSEAGKGELFDGAGGAAADAELKQDGAHTPMPLHIPRGHECMQTRRSHWLARAIALSQGMHQAEYVPLAAVEHAEAVRFNDERRTGASDTAIPSTVGRRPTLECIHRCARSCARSYLHCRHVSAAAHHEGPQGH